MPSKLQKHAAKGGKVYVLLGSVTDPEAHGGRAEIGAPEYRFTADDPDGEFGVGYTEDYIDLPEGFCAYPGAEFIKCWDDEPETPETVDLDQETAEVRLNVTLSCVVTAGLYAGPLTRETVTGLVRDWFIQGEDFNAFEDAIDKVEMIGLDHEDGTPFLPCLTA